MKQVSIFFVIALVVMISIIESVFSYIWYGVVSTWYFISDYWLIALAVFLGLIAFSGETKKQKAGLGAAALAFALFYIGDAHYISAEERSSAHTTAEKITAIYSHCRLDGNANVTCALPVSRFCTNNVDLCEEQLEEGLEDWGTLLLEKTFGPKHKSYALYRELDVGIREFVESGGSFDTYIQTHDGKNIFLVRNEGGIDDYSIERLM